MGFWQWFFGTGSISGGYRNLLNLWLILHMAIGILLALFVPVCMSQAANSVLLPFAGILIGLCFAWGGNTNALIQSEEVEEITTHYKGRFEDYAYQYQLSILIVMVTLILWTLAGLGISNLLWPKQGKSGFSYYVILALLFSLSSMTIREAWHIVLMAQLLLIKRQEIRKAAGKFGINKKNNSDEENK